MRKVVLIAMVVAFSGPALAQRPLDKRPTVSERMTIVDQSTPGHPEGSNNVAESGGAGGGGAGGE